MTNNNVSRCGGSITAGHMQKFLALPTTTSPEAYKKHWAKLPEADIRILEIQQSQFSNAVQIISKAADAYVLFEKLTTLALKPCKFLFAKWKNGDLYFEFLVTDSAQR